MGEVRKGKGPALRQVDPEVARAILAEKRSLHTAALTRGKRLAVMAIPIPVPQIRTPRGTFPRETARATFPAGTG